MPFVSNKNHIAQYNMGNNLDVIASLDPKGYGVYKILYELAKEKAGGSFTVAAAKEFDRILEKGDVVFFITGFVLTPFLKAETDGIGGTIMLARALEKAYGIIPVYFCPKDAEDGLLALTEKYGAKGNVVVFEKDFDKAKAQAEEILKDKLPKACVSIEAPGSNFKGVYHNAAGLDVSEHEAKMDILFKALGEKDVTTFSIGDLGNEIGMGTLKEGIVNFIPRTGEGECNCGCEGGVLSATCADFVVTGTTSDWAGYALANAVAYISGNVEASPTKENVEAMLCEEGKYDLIDMLGEPIPAVDGYDLETNLLVVSMMNKLVRDFEKQSSSYTKWYDEIDKKGYFTEAKWDINVDLNSDLGEGEGNTISDIDRGIISVITSANIACGWHAGNLDIMEDAVKCCIENGTFIGAHPGFDDRENFGRTEMEVSEEEAYGIVFKQVRELQEIAKAQGTFLHHVKPHGALYNMAGRDLNLATAIANAIKDSKEFNGGKDIIFYGLAGSKMAEAAENVGLTFYGEVFADRAYNDDGSLVSRKLEGAVIHDKQQVVERTKKMIEEAKVLSINENEIDIQADTVCVHGDTAGALELAKAIKAALQ